MRAVAAALLLLITACLAWPPAQAQLYKWTDEQGRIHYSDKAPDKDKAKAAVIKIESYSGPAVVSTLEKSAAAALEVPVFLLALRRFFNVEVLERNTPAVQVGAGLPAVTAPARGQQLDAALGGGRLIGLGRGGRFFQD